MTSVQKCLVVGATGYIGLPLTLALAREGLQVFALVRHSSREKNAESLEKLQAVGVRLLDGDISDLACLQSAFTVLAPVDIVVSAVAGPQVLQQSNLIQAALEAGTVKRFLPSEFSVDIPRARGRLPFLTEPRSQIMEQIQSVGLPYTVITSNGFIEDWFAGLGQLGNKTPPDEVIVFGDGEVQGVATTRQDIAAFAAKAATDPRMLNKRLIIRPSSNIASQNELIKMWEQISGKQVQKQYMSADELESNIKEGTMNLKASDNYDARTYLQLAQSFWIFGDSLLPTPDDGLEATALYTDVQYTTIKQWFQQVAAAKAQ